MGTPARKRASKGRPTGREDLQRQLFMWRGYVMVSIAGAGLASFAAAYFSRQGDVLTATLFLLTFFVLAVVALVSLVRVRVVRTRIGTHDAE